MFSVVYIVNKAEKWNTGLTGIPLFIMLEKWFGWNKALRVLKFRQKIINKKEGNKKWFRVNDLLLVYE